MDKYSPGIGYCAGYLMLKWNTLNQILLDLKLTNSSKVNLFINFESILRNICKFKKFNTVFSYFTQSTVLDFESSVLNLIAHYRGYFKKLGIDCKIYLYYTDLEKDLQTMKSEFKYYRNYYYNKYKNNPEFKNIYKLLKIAIPDLELILSFVNGAYLVKVDNCDGSIIPKLISQDSDRINILISEDLFDSLYLFEGFKVIYIKRSFSKNINRCVFTEPIGVVSSLVNYDDIFDLALFENEMFFKLLLDFNGSPIRNLTPFSDENLILDDFKDLLISESRKSEVFQNFESVKSLNGLFPKKLLSDLTKTVKAFDLKLHLIKLKNSNLILDNLVDKFDNENLMALNNQRFLDFPLKIVDLI